MYVYIHTQTYIYIYLETPLPHFFGAIAKAPKFKFVRWFLGQFDQKKYMSVCMQLIAPVPVAGCGSHRSPCDFGLFSLPGPKLLPLLTTSFDTRRTPILSSEDKVSFDLVPLNCSLRDGKGMNRPWQSAHPSNEILISLTVVIVGW